MKITHPIFVLCVLAVVCLAAAIAGAQNDSAGLDRVLTQMDTAAKNLRSTEANFVWDHYDSVIKELDDHQTGKIYFRRDGGAIQMAVDITDPQKEYILYSGGKVQIYRPKIDEVDEYSPGKNRADVESYLVLGFGGGGHDLLKSYDVKSLGSETVGGIAAGKLDLVPKSAHIQGIFAHILLWIDPARGVSVQQQFFEPSGNYRLAKYSDIQIDQKKIPDSVFKLKTTGKTRFISPKG